MAMAMANHPEDAASVLEQFVHDVANVPAEITHLYEEVAHKDTKIAVHQDEINKREAQLQKWVRLNGGHVRNPKEDAYNTSITSHYDAMEILQAEKRGLAEKAEIVLTRHIKKLDVGIAGLQQTEQFPSDWPGPSLVNNGGAPTGVSTPAPGAGPTPTGPLQVVSGNIGTLGGAPNIANAAQMRLAQNVAGGAVRNSNSGNQTPTTVPRGQREGSSEANKRRKLNISLGNLPTATSGLRQSSLGPGTPKTGTPVPVANTSSRAGSVQPARPSGGHKKGAAPAGATRKVAPPPAKKIGGVRQKTGKKSSRRHQLTTSRATPSTNASLSDDEDDSASPTPSSIQRSQHDGSGEADGDEAEEDDKTLYCLCQKVSFGDMVGCDNQNCRYQWFHYKCVGVTEDPGENHWLCPECSKLPRSKVKLMLKE